MIRLILNLIFKVNLKESSSDDNKYWKSGVGYGYSGKRKMNIENLLKMKRKVWKI